MKKLRVGILFGGRSGEHEVSVLSAASVFNAIDKSKFEVVPIGITKEGRWVTAAHAERLLKGMPLEHEERHLRAGDPDATAGAAVLATGEAVIVPPEPAHRESGMTPFQTDAKKIEKLVEKRVKYPVFVKPANLGSSVGISKAHNRKELGPAIAEAARFDRKIVIEQGVGGAKQKAREIECSVLGNDAPQASVPGEIVPGKEFYDYTAKYVDEGSELVIPATLTKAETKKVQELAIKAFQAVDCSGLARVDFLMDPKNRKIWLNEINTMPGFTSISMYPKLWAASGVSYSDLIEKLIQLGLERHGEKKKNQYSR